MQNQLHARFLLANRELSEFLHRAQGLATDPRAVTEDELKIISAHLITVAPEVGDAARGETLDADLQEDVAEYVKNLRALRSTLEIVRSITHTRRRQVDTSKPRTKEPHSWVDPCLHIT
jgi:hypothetical protein